ncbi:MAG: hypothetical protein FJX29_09080, partial [Alphaproteobacteria bacterium]|nr:hypothetical protein [Alphaproteobacteria bacterium]
MTISFERASGRETVVAALRENHAFGSRGPGPQGSQHSPDHAHRLAPSKIIATALIIDALALVASGWAAAASHVPGGVGLFAFLATAAVTAGMITVSGLRWSYTIPALTRATRQIAEAGVMLFAALSALIMVMFLLGFDLTQSRSWIAWWFAGAWAGLALSRIATATLLKHWSAQGRLVRRTVIAGGGQTAADMITRLEATAGDAIQIVGMFDDRGADRSPEVADHYPKIGTFDDLTSFCRTQAIDLIIVALPPSAEDRIMQLLGKFWVLPVDIRIAANTSKLKLRAR